MKEHPILFSGEMVRAILDGSKTQTRRVIKPQPIQHSTIEDIRFYWLKTKLHYSENQIREQLPNSCPYGQPSDRLWVKETWAKNHPVLDNKVRYRADLLSPDLGKPWRSSRFMPKWVSRIWLEVVQVRVERVQEISPADAFAEGWPRHLELYPNINTEHKTTTWYHQLWDSLNAKRGYGWDVNPWVWVIEYKMLEVKG